MSAGPSGDSSDSLLGRTLDGRYRLEARIGGGGMGEVYRARHLMMDQRVAVKVLNPERAGDPESVRRFMREARQTFRFDHSNCVRVTDFGATEDGLLYLVMEYLDGRTAEDELGVDGPFAPARVAHVCRQLCDALDHAHAMGLVHRDLKPANVMLLRRAGDPDFVKVLDFGLAKIYDIESVPGTLFSFSPLTREGMVFGTPAYMSPEQASGAALGPASDLYSVGVVAYELLTGEVPFAGGSFMAVLSRHVKEPPMPPSQRRPHRPIPAGLERVVLRCLEKDPSRRPPDARALSKALSELEQDLKEQAAARVPAALATSQTVDLGPGGPEPAATSAPDAGEPRGSRRRWVALAAGALAIGVGAMVALELGGESGPVEAAAGADVGDRGDASSSDPRPVTETPPATAPPPPTEPPPAVEAGAEADRGAAQAEAKEPGAGPERRPKRRKSGSGRPKSENQRLVERHVAAAERARAAGNHLKQLAHADKARKLAPKHRRARFLFGDALVKTGQKDKGCRYLRSWRRHHQQVGCTD